MAGTGPRALLARHGLRAKKAWGQNFLVDERIIERIADALAPGTDDVVVEIGAGTGALTRALAARAAKVIAVERDPDMVAILLEEFADAAVEVRLADAVTFDLEAVARTAGRKLLLAGNLPYQITSPILFRIAHAPAVLERAVVMIQREVALRAVAAPDTEDYGRLSVMLQQAASPKRLFDVFPGAFLPQPRVTSTVMSLAPRAAPLAPVRDAATFDAVVRASFGARRKTLRRALGDAFGDTAAAAALAAAHVEPTRRGETLSVADFARIADAFAPQAVGRRPPTAPADSARPRRPGQA